MLTRKQIILDALERSKPGELFVETSRIATRLHGSRQAQLAIGLQNVAAENRASFYSLGAAEESERNHLHAKIQDMREQLMGYQQQSHARRAYQAPARTPVAVFLNGKR